MRALIVVLACGLLAHATTVSAKVASKDEELTKQAIQLYQQNQPRQACALEQQAVKFNAGNWRTHAVLSFFLWQEHQTSKAIAEGKLAVRLAPREPTSLINLGIMQHLYGEQEQALRSFTKARALAPSNWQTWIGQAQCLILVGRRDEAMSILQNMDSKRSNDFDWYYALASAYLYVDRPDLAATSALTASKLATTAGEKSASLFQLFFAYIRDNRIERAHELKHQVFTDNEPLDAQIYIGAVLSLVPSLKPAEADEILNAALVNLNRVSECDAFFRLARIFADKAKYVSYDRTKYGAWLDKEETAYRQAIQLNGGTAIYHLGLATVLAQKNRALEMVSELLKARAIDERDQLTGYLLSQMEPVQIGAASEQQPTLSAKSTSPSCRVHLTEAKISIKGLTCACKRTIIANSFRQIRGLVLTTITPKIPFKATVLIDQSMIPISDAMTQMTNKKPFPQLDYELVSCKPISNVADALQDDLDGHDQRDFLFAKRWSQLQVTLP